MSLSFKKKELTLQDTFYNLCKDLIRYIDKKIVKKYISPNQAQIPKEKRVKEKKYDDNKWRYFYEDEETTEEERVKDIFKNNTFLFNLQNLYNSLNIIVINMEENKKNLENLNKQLEMESQKLKAYDQINIELAKYFIENNTNINNMNQNELTKILESLEKNDIFKNINKEVLQQLIISNNFNNNNMPFNNAKIQNNINKDSNLINNNSEIQTKENNIMLNANNTKNINNIKNTSNNQNIIKNNIKINNSIPTLIQALERVNKYKNNINVNNNKKVFRKNNILDSDSSDSDEDNDEDEDDENENEDKIAIKNNKFEKQKMKKEENDCKNTILNKKTKRKKNKK